MKLYAMIISCCVVAISAVVSLALHINFWWNLGLTTLATLAVILVDGLTAGLARISPKKVAQHDGKIYTVSAKEKQFYEKLKIRDWKEKLPEIGHLTGFRKNKIADPKSIEYLERFLLEICYGELGHFASLFTGFLIVCVYPFSSLWIAVSIPVAIINLILNLPFLFVLRYNSYKMEILRKKLLKRTSNF